MDDLRTWLGQQVDTDERVAQEAIAENDGDADWQITQPGPNEPSWSTPRLLWLNVMNSCDPESMPPAMAEHIARWGPKRALAEVNAKRRIMAIHNRRADVFPGDAGGTFDNCCDGCGYEGICDDPVTEDINDCPELRALTEVYAGQPGYRDEWRPA